VRDLLTKNGALVPYSHQAEVPVLIDEGKNVSLRTPTASGKTVSFLAPTLTILLKDPGAVALMLYPVNALAADQLKNLIGLGFKPDPKHEGIVSITLGGQEITAGVLNGDTPDTSRKIIRSEARLILTNPVALHASVLSQANHRYSDGTSWNRVLRNTHMVVLDEAHLQNGIQGTQSALAFRRFMALAEAKGAKAKPQIILSTATIGNPHAGISMIGGIGDFGQFTAYGPDGREEIQRLSGQDAILNWHVGAVIRSFSGKTFEVVALDCATQKVSTNDLPASVTKMYTSPSRDRQVTIQTSEDSPVIQAAMVGIRTAITGDFDVREQTIGYKRFTWERGEDKPYKEMVDLPAELMNPAIGYSTRGVEMVLDASNPVARVILNTDNSDNVCEALGDALHKTLPIVVQARPEDVELAILEIPDGVKFQFFDVADGGMGWSEAAAPRIGDWLKAAGLLLGRCSCRGQGCPKCTLAPITEVERRELGRAIQLTAGR
jgi:ATP-dependent helicase YprA (DUF1998 family)